MEVKTDITEWEAQSEKNKKALDLIDKNRDFVYEYDSFKSMAKYYKSQGNLETKHNLSPANGPTLLPLIEELEKHWQSGT